jgi:hypothetical protein
MPIITNSAPLFVKINAPEARGGGGEDFGAREALGEGGL